MYTFLLRPRWIAFHVVVVLAIVAMINLGLWQLRRLDDRRDFNAVIEERYDEPAVALSELIPPGADVDPDRLAWRPITTSGRYVPDERILIVNRSQNGRAGVNVVVPLVLDDGRILLVNRGFVPLGLDVPGVPAIDVELTARLRAGEERRFAQLSDPDTGALREAQRVDIDRLTGQLPGPVVPMFVDLVVSTPPEIAPFPEPVAPPDLSEGNHLSYAVQWFIFSTAVAVGWVLAVRRSARTRRRSAGEATSEVAEVTAPEPASH